MPGKGPRLRGLELGMACGNSLPPPAVRSGLSISRRPLAFPFHVGLQQLLDLGGLGPDHAGLTRKIAAAHKGPPTGRFGNEKTSAHLSVQVQG